MTFDASVKFGNGIPVVVITVKHASETVGNSTCQRCCCRLPHFHCGRVRELPNIRFVGSFDKFRENVVCQRVSLDNAMICVEPPMDAQIDAAESILRFGFLE